jgi:hypothetical protein
MLQIPLDPPPSFNAPPLLPLERFLACVLVAAVVVLLLSLLLPRPWFVALLRIAFPWLPERLKDSAGD